MANQGFCILSLSLPAALFALLASKSAFANPKNESIQEQNLYNYGTTKPSNSLLDVTNPMELMNRLRNSSSMDSATSPRDAVDEALRQLDKPAAPARKVLPVGP